MIDTIKSTNPDKVIFQNLLQLLKNKIQMNMLSKHNIKMQLKII